MKIIKNNILIPVIIKINYQFQKKFKNTYDKRLNKIEELGNKVNYDDLS